MHQPDPTFPPLLTGHDIKSPMVAFEHAVAGAKAGTFGAGDFIWSRNTQRLECAVVLEPEVSRQHSLEMLHVAMVAFADAFGVLAPPEIGVLYQWPNKLRINAGEVGEVRIAVSNEMDDAGVPDWMVLDLVVQLRPAKMVLDPGEDMDFTNLLEEGCVEVTRTEFLESYARQLLTWIHSWASDGFRHVHDTWLERLENKGDDCKILYDGEIVSGAFAGLDEFGNLLLRDGGETKLLKVEIALGIGQGTK